MALSTADLVQAFKVGARFVTVDALGKATETHQDYSSAVKSGGHPVASVSKLDVAGGLTAIANTTTDRHNYGKSR